MKHPWPRDPAAALAQLLAQRAVAPLFQPIVCLTTGATVGWEALARGPAGSPLERPAELFTVARRERRLTELDRLCRDRAFEEALAAGLGEGRWLSVNVEPEALAEAGRAGLETAAASRAMAELDVVVELTERELTASPAAVIDLVDAIRGAGWRVALDDVGADPASLALMPLLRPDVVKLDLRLVQRRPTLELARIVSAVNAEAERSGAVLLAEGIETEEHRETALSMGATLGQGWLFARPAPLVPPPAPLAAPVRLPKLPLDALAATPVEVVADRGRFREARKDLLIEVSKHLEAEAAGLGPSALVLSAFQHARHFTPGTRRRYAELARRVGFVAALGEGMAFEPLPGIRGGLLPSDDPMLDEWDIAVLGPHFAAALVARDLGDDGHDLDRRFEYVLTYDRDLVRRVSRAMLQRVPTTFATSTAPAPRAHRRPPAPTLRGAPGGEDRPRGASRSPAPCGITIWDVRDAAVPVTYADAGIERLTGLAAAELLGRTAAFVGGDPLRATVDELAAAIAAGVAGTVDVPCRRPDGGTWTDRVTLSPVRDADGAVTHCLGVHTVLPTAATDVADVAADLDRDHRQDELTGLLTADALHAATSPRCDGRVVLVVAVDGPAELSSRHGRPVIDEVLRTQALRLRRVVRAGDLLARTSDDEFVVVLHDADSAGTGHHVASRTREVLTAPVTVAGSPIDVNVRVGVAGPDAAAELVTLVERARDAAGHDATATGQRTATPATGPTAPRPAASSSSMPLAGTGRPNR